jgi:hypothetical protein
MTRRYLDTEGAAEYVGISKSWLAHARMRYEGPRWIQPRGTNIIMYDVQDLDKWVAENKSPEFGDGPSFPQQLPPRKVDPCAPAPPAKRRRGRPTKAETIARRNAAANQLSLGAKRAARKCV